MAAVCEVCGQERRCLNCGEPIDSTRRSDARHCYGSSCRAEACRKRDSPAEAAEAAKGAHVAPREAPKKARRPTHYVVVRETDPGTLEVLGLTQARTRKAAIEAVAGEAAEGHFAIPNRLFR